MADISTYLAAIMSAVYGEDVRGSIHDAIELINDVSEKVIDTGTAVTSASSSSTGYYKDSLYINTSTYDLWRCIGTDSWALLGNIKGAAGKGISSIAKTSTSGLVDTYTITYSDGTTSTFDVTNGADGTDGNDGNDGVSVTGVSLISKVGLLATYRMTFSNGTYFDYTVSDGASGSGTGDMTKAVYDTDNDGIVDAAETLSGLTATIADLNKTASLATVATSGSYNDLSNKPTIPTVDQTYNATSSNAQSGKAVAEAVGALPTTLSELSDTTILTPVSGQILEYNGTNWGNGDNIKDFARYGGSKVFSDLTSALLTAANVDKFFLVTDGGTISAADAANWVLPQGSVIPPDAHIAVIEYGAGIYKFDDFGGYVDISGKADKSALDDWVATGTVSGGAVSFSGIDDSGNYAYKPFAEITSSSTNKNPSAQISTLSGTGTSSMSVTYTTDADNGTTVKLRRIK